MENCGTCKVFFQSLLVLLLCSIFCVANTNLKYFSKRLSENQLNHVSSFSNCLLYLINFDGYVLNLSVLSQPVLLLRYFSMANKLQIIPVEYYNCSQTLGHKYIYSLTTLIYFLRVNF